MKITTITLLFLMLIGPVISWADIANGNIDLSQQGGANVSYDLPSKWYAGIDGGLSIYTNISEAHPGVGAFFGYKFNEYFAMELDYQFPGNIGTSAGNNLPPGYRGTFNIVSAELSPMYPVIKHFEYTISVFAIGGYGICFSNYQYQSINGQVENSYSDGAFNAGLGSNLDLRSNVSIRLMYLYQQVRYPNPMLGANSYGDNEINVGIYYNF